MYPGSHAEDAPDRPAVIMAGTGETITYAQLDAAARRLADLYGSLGLGVGDHVAFCVENHPRYYELAWGAAYAGLYYTAMSSRLTAEEAAYIVNDCGARVFITSAYKREMAEALVPDTPDVELRLMLDDVVTGYEPYEATVDARTPAAPDPEHVAGTDMLYSSGTTGRPKGIKPPLPTDTLETLNTLTAGSQLLFGFGPDTVYLSPAPLYHAAPLRFTMGVHRLGGTVVVMEHFDAAEFLALVERYHVTHTQVVPTMFVRMLKLDEAQRQAHDLSSLQVAIHAAAPCPIPVKEAMMAWWGPVIHEYYAGTEGNGLVYAGPQDWLDHKGTVGKALTGAVHICDEEGNEVPTGEEGTIFFSGGADFEYHNDPEKTAGAHNAAGWSTLGDIGRLDDDGFLYLTDRKAHMIITGGVNVYPQEAENVLALHPAVYDVAVIGVPNEEFGEEVKAVVQPADGAETGPALERELIAYCREHLADVKCPRSVDFLDELPRHPTGKLYKRLLRDRYWEGHTSRLV